MSALRATLVVRSAITHVGPRARASASPAFGSKKSALIRPRKSAASSNSRIPEQRAEGGAGAGDRGGGGGGGGKGKQGAAGSSARPGPRPWYRISIRQVTSAVGFTVAFTSLLYFTANNVVEVNRCLGPSMMPTLMPFGDFVLCVHLPVIARWEQARAFLRRISGRRVDERELYLSGNADFHSDSPSFTQGLKPSYKWTSSKTDRTCGLPLRLGDVVVSYSPADPSRQICKRIVGLPGDEVVVHPSRMAPVEVEVTTWSDGPNQGDDEGEDGASTGVLLLIPFFSVFSPSCPSL